jgi:DNA-binding protein HU-beta
MSEKVTFQELIDAIAEETDNSKQFTHDFLKDFVTVINDGLEAEGSVNIAGFGKFDLKRVDEREGYNPQTEEKMTIPAHNKIVFKPYKDLRELVNAPYAHLEPELIEEDEDENAESTAEEGATDHEGKDETDFIPTAPPTQETKSGSDENPFDFDTEEEQEPVSETEESGEQDDADIVEFNPEQVEDENQEAGDVDGDLDEFINTPGDSKEEMTSDDQLTEDESEETDNKLETSENVNEQNDEDDDTGGSKFAPSSQEQSSEEVKEATPTPSFREERHQKRQVSSMPVMIVAAAFILLIAAGGAWYFGLVSESETGQMAMETTTTTTDDVAPTNDESQQAEAANNNQQQPTTGQNQQATAKQNKNQSQQTTVATQPQNTDSETEGVEIQDGQTLWSIAEDKYGNPRLWPWIYGKNESLENPDLILAGNSLTVPLPSGPQNSLTATDSTGVAKGFISTYHWYKTNNSSKAKDHIWAAKLYHDNIRDISDVPIDEEDLAYANRAR